jgi:hypothetical protein
MLRDTSAAAMEHFVREIDCGQLCCRARRHGWAIVGRADRAPTSCDDDNIGTVALGPLRACNAIGEFGREVIETALWRWSRRNPLTGMNCAVDNIKVTDSLDTLSKFRACRDPRFGRAH